MNGRSKVLTALVITCPLMAALPLSLQAAAQDSNAEMKAYTDANQKMMDAMGAMKPVGEADKDFVMMMMPHHQGAIDMAQIQLKYGKDPMLRQMAEQIIKSQQEEIDKMKKWQQEHGM